MSGQEIISLKPQDGSPHVHLNAGAAAYTTLLDSPGVNSSYYVTGVTLSGGSNGDGVSFIRRSSVKFTGASAILTVETNYGSASPSSSPSA